jgi:hypothetical protein
LLLLVKFSLSPFVLLRVLAMNRAPPLLTPLEAALLLVKQHVKTRRPGVKSYHLSILKDWLDGSDPHGHIGVHGFVRRLWLLVVSVGLGGPLWHQNQDLRVDYFQVDGAGHRVVIPPYRALGAAVGVDVLLADL